MSNLFFVYEVANKRFYHEETGYEIGMNVIQNLPNNMLKRIIYDESGLVVDDLLLDGMRNLNLDIENPNSNPESESHE